MSRVTISRGLDANVIRKWLPLYRDQPVIPSLPAFTSLKAARKRRAETSVIIELPMAGIRFGQQIERVTGAETIELHFQRHCRGRP
ncbi:hypothetical protein [Pseudomonas laurentiana]